MDRKKVELIWRSWLSATRTAARHKVFGVKALHFVSVKILRALERSHRFQ